MKIILGLILATMVLPVSAHAAPVLDPYTEEHFWLLPHSQPAWFETDGHGGYYGETTDGVRFTQSIVTNQTGIRLQRFTIGTASIYISDQGIIEGADSDLSAVSMYLAHI